MVRKLGLIAIAIPALTIAACTSSTTPTRASTTLITVRLSSSSTTPTTTSPSLTLFSKPTIAPGLTSSKPPTRGRASSRVSWITATGAAGNLWLLGEYGCPVGLCVMILRSENGGASFVRVGAPPVYGERDVTTDGLSVGSLLFANKEDGYAYARGGPTGERSLYRTGDGGMTWQLVHLEGALASEIVVAGGRVYTVAYRCRSASCTDYDVISSSERQNSWTTTNRLPSAETKGENVTLAAFDSNVWVVLTSQGGGGAGRVLISHNGARSFAESPPTLGGFSCFLAATSAETLWGTCYSIHTSFNVRSTDGGSQFSGIGGIAASGEFGSTSLLPLSDREAVLLFYNPLVYVPSVLEVTTDGGRSFQPVLGHLQVLAVGFATRTSWLALRASMKGKGNLAWRTTNSGRSWHTVTLPNS